MMPHVSGNQLLVTGTGAVVVLSLAATWNHAPNLMAEGGSYALLGSFMASLATLTLLVTLLFFGAYITLIVLFAILQKLNVPLVNDLVTWIDKHAEPDWTDGRTVDPMGQAWRNLFGEDGSTRINMICQFAELAVRPIAAVLILLIAMLW